MTIPPPHCGNCEICNNPPGTAQKVHLLLTGLCAELGVDPSYVEAINFRVGQCIEVTLQDSVEGKKFVHIEDDHPRIGELAVTVHHVKLVAI